VDEFGLEKLGVVVQQIDRWLLDRLTALNRNGRVRGNRPLLIRTHCGAF
jgi:acyl-CoA synthetase (NDP forming)